MSDLGFIDFISEMKARAAEKLSPELEAWLCETDFVGTCLKHPLVFQIPFHPARAWEANRQLTQKRAAVAKAKEANNWAQVMWLHERPYRSDVVEESRDHLEPENYWKLVGMLWCDTENLHHWGNAVIRRILFCNVPGRCHMMDADEHEALVAMPPTLEIFRGYTSPRGTRKGWSWTLNRSLGEWFSTRLLRKDEDETPRLIHGLVERNDVIAYFTRRGEEEIVVDPGKVRIRGIR